jgi:tRNA threonylcarbamoyladenosine modification (KEOPS) complex  Pcc1 subunit
VIKKKKATVRLRLPSTEKLNIVLNSLKPEANNPSTARAHTILKGEDEFLILIVEANDTVALRASLNAYLRWTNSILNVLEALKAQ